MSTETDNDIPGSDTPEYKQAYDAAMDELNNPKPKEEIPEVEEEPQEVPEPETTDTPAADDQAKFAEMEKRFASTEKALKDTQKWGHNLATTVKELKKQLETATKAERPALLDQVDGLQDAIDYRVNAAKPAQEDNDIVPPSSPEQPTWVEMVDAALPDMDAMLNDPELKAKAKALHGKHVEEWLDDPVKAVRYFSDLRTEHLTQKAVREAIAATSAKQIETQQRKDGMRVPLGGSKAVRTQAVDLVNDADAVNNLTHDQFQKLRQKTLGY